jgi:hypothetical protein
MGNEQSGHMEGNGLLVDDPRAGAFQISKKRNSKSRGRKNPKTIPIEEIDMSAYHQKKDPDAVSDAASAASIAGDTKRQESKFVDVNLSSALNAKSSKRAKSPRSPKRISKKLEQAPNSQAADDLLNFFQDTTPEAQHEKATEQADDIQDFFATPCPKDAQLPTPPPYVKPVSPVAIAQKPMDFFVQPEPAPAKDHFAEVDLTRSESDAEFDMFCSAASQQADAKKKTADDDQESTTSDDHDALDTISEAESDGFASKLRRVFKKKNKDDEHDDEAGDSNQKKAKSTKKKKKKPTREAPRKMGDKIKDMLRGNKNSAANEKYGAVSLASGISMESVPTLDEQE